MFSHIGTGSLISPFKTTVVFSDCELIVYVNMELNVIVFTYDFDIVKVV